MSCSTKIYKKDGGNTLYIGGEVILASDAVITDRRPSPVKYVPASNASTAANAVKDLNFLITSLKEAGIITPTAPTVDVITFDTEKSVIVGEAITLEVNAEASDGRELEYQWYASFKASTSEGTIISGATQPVYIPVTSTVGTYYYYCTVSDGSQGATKAFTPLISDLCTVVVSEA